MAVRVKITEADDVVEMVSHLETRAILSVPVAACQEMMRQQNVGEEQGEHLQA